MGGDMSTSEDDRERGVIVTLVERRTPTATFVGGGRDTERRGDIPVSRKCAVSSDPVVEREAKRVWSPCPSEASLASPPCPEHGGARRPAEGACSYPHIFRVGACT